MSTAVEGAADDDADPVSRNWCDQFTNHYMVTGCRNTYSVTIKYKQDSKNVEQLRSLKRLSYVMRAEATHGEKLTSYTYVRMGTWCGMP